MILEIAFKEFNRHKLRTFLTMLGVTIGVFLLTSISSISEGLTLYINEQISLTSGLVFVRENDIPLFMIYRSEISQDITDDIKNIEGIDRIAEILIVNSDIGRVIGVNPENKELLRGVNIDIEEGREYDANQYEVVVGKKLAEKMDYVVGDEIKIFDKNLEIVGILEETGKEQLDNSLFVDLEVLQEISKKNDKITFLLIKPIRVEDAGKIEEEINDNIDGIEASTDKSLMNNVNRTLSQLNIMTFALGGIAGLISGIVIMNVMLISVRQRRREIGIMKAVGATNKQILLAILFEAVTICLLGAILGFILSFGGVVFLNSILSRPFAKITLRLFIQGFLFSVLIGVVSGILPARMAARLDPIEALRYE